MKKQISQAVGGAVATATIPASFGVVDWRILAGAAALGALGGLFGFDVAKNIKGRFAKPKVEKVGEV